MNPTSQTDHDQPGQNSLYFGDNLDVLRESMRDESVDLVYLDPPFNSSRDYNILFASPKNERSDAQITAFKDTWHWGRQAEREFGEIVRSDNTHAAEMIQALRRFMGENDMMAYLTMMANRLLELYRVLKPTGSLYLHCDPTASHYLKIVLDAVFGIANFRTEISWRRSGAHNDAKQGRAQYGNVRDTIFFYTKSAKWSWNWLYTGYGHDYLEKMYRHVEPETGRRYQLDNLTGPGGAAKGNPLYEVMGVTRHWRYSREKMDELIAEGRIVQTREGNVPRYKRYLDEMSGVPLQNDWNDILSAMGSEYLGYPTQKPLALLERIINASSNEGDVVLDPFCGCGTTVHAAQKLGRQWIGIDITHLAVSLIEKRLKDAFPGIGFDVHGTPRDIAGARDLARRDKYQFQWWACSLVNAQPYQGKKKGADGGIDGLIYFQDELKGYKKIVVSVKGGENVSVAMVRDFAHVIERERAEIGLFVTLSAPSKPMETEAVKAGYYTNPHGASFPKIQILTIDDLLTGAKRPLYSDLAQGAVTFKKAGREEKRHDQNDLF
ncbi:MAG: restriction endonuclease [Betaproteobacteria bacterium]|nr:restriction endonuclease [Betaproteobacteria bacterium]